MSQYPQYNDNQVEYGTKFPKLTLAARVVTLASLTVSVAVLKTNDFTYDGYVVTYKNFCSYNYMFYVTVIGLVYTLLQIPFAIYDMLTKKHLINSFHFLKYSFYVDLIVVLILAITVGLGFGATMDFKRIGGNETDESKVQDFLTMIYIPAAFLLVGCLASAISTVHSALALTKINDL